MAREMKLILTDDFDGSVAAETVSFSLDDHAYEIELSSENAQKLRDAMAPFIAKARRIPASRMVGTRRRGAAGASASKTTAKIREWARAQGHDVSERGRIPYEIVEAYRAAH